MYTLSLIGSSDTETIKESNSLYSIITELRESIAEDLRNAEDTDTVDHLDYLITLSNSEEYRVFCDLTATTIVRGEDEKTAEIIKQLLN